MALPNSSMSITLALSSGLFFRRAEAASGENPGPNCLADVTVSIEEVEIPFTNIVMQPSSAKFFTDDDGIIFLDLFLRLQGTLIGITKEIQNAFLRMRLNATTVDAQVINLRLVYEELVIPDAGDLTPEQNDEIQESMAAALEAATFQFSISALVAGDRLLAGQPEMVIAAPDSSGFGATLVLGLEIEDDQGIDRNGFRAAFEEDPLEGVGMAWRLDVDSELMRERIAETLDETDFTEDAESGGIPGWISTENTRVLWAGDELSGDLHFQQAYIEERYLEHPVWFFLEGYRKAGFGVASLIYAAGYGEFALDTDTRRILFSPTIYAAGFGIIPLPVPSEEDSEDASVPVANAEVADALLATEISFDVNRLFIGGIDEHPGLPGSPQISVPTALDVRFSSPNRDGCEQYLPVRSPDGKAKKDFAIMNVGDAPLWVCDLGFENDDGTFSIQLPEGLPLFEVATGGRVFVVPPYSEVLVRVNLTTDDHATHTGELVLRCNDFSATRVRIALTGQIEEGRENQILGRVLCVKKPEPIPPPEWFEGIFEVISSLDELVQPQLNRDDELEITFTGIPTKTDIDVLDLRGRWLGTAFDYGDIRHVSLPVGKERDFRLTTALRTGALKLHLGISHTNLLGEYRLDDAPQAVVGRDTLIVIAGRHHVSILSLADPQAPREIAVLELGGVNSLELQEKVLIAGTTDKTLEFFSLEDPYQPRQVHKMEAGNSLVRMVPEGFVLEEPKGMRVYTTTASGRPRLIKEVFEEDALPAAFRGRERRTRLRDSSWGTTPYLPRGRLAQGRYVLELATDTKAPTLRILDKVPSKHIFDETRLRDLLSLKRVRRTRI